MFSHFANILVSLDLFWQRTPEGMRDFRARLTDAFQEFIISNIGDHPVSSLPFRDIFVKIVVSYFVDGEMVDRQDTHYASVQVGNARVGVIKFRAICVLCEPVGDDILIMKRQAFRKLRHDLPFGGKVSSGVFMHIAHDDLAAMVLDSSSGGDTDSDDDHMQ